MLNFGRRLTCNLPWDREPLSGIEQAVYDWIRSFHAEHGRVPGIQFCAQRFSIGKSSAANIFLCLCIKGWLGEVMPFSNNRRDGGHYLNDQPDECCEDCLGVVDDMLGSPDGECRR